MDEVRSLFLGVAGGVLGAFFKFWIEDLRNWQNSRLTRREKELLGQMKKENGIARFIIKRGRPPIFSNQYEDIDRPEENFEFEDLGEIDRILKLGLIELIGLNDTERIYRLTGKGYK